jgi:hypothetical protein
MRGVVVDNERGYKGYMDNTSSYNAYHYGEYVPSRYTMVNTFPLIIYSITSTRTPLAIGSQRKKEAEEDGEKNRAEEASERCEQKKRADDTRRRHKRKKRAVEPERDIEASRRSDQAWVGSSDMVTYNVPGIEVSI